MIHTSRHLYDYPEAFASKHSVKEFDENLLFPKNSAKILFIHSSSYSWNRCRVRRLINNSVLEAREVLEVIMTRKAPLVILVFLLKLPSGCEFEIFHTRINKPIPIPVMLDDSSNDYRVQY